MVYCNLAVLLAQRQLKISDVSSETGISRTTLTAMARNYGKGIQLDTVNTLCMYLGITVGELYTFFPFDIEVHSCRYDKDSETAEIEFSYKAKKITDTLLCPAYVYIFSSANRITVDLDEDAFEGDEAQRERFLLQEAFCALPIPEIDRLKENIAEQIIESVSWELDKNARSIDELCCPPADQWEIEVNLPQSWQRGS